jgi:hypothetical protein
MKPPHWEMMLAWLRSHPGVFTVREEGEDLFLLEGHSIKTLPLRARDVDLIEEKQNTVIPGETYILIVKKDGQQLVLSSHGFAFPPSYVNIGPLPLPSQVYCMEDFRHLFSKLKHLASEAERREEALALILLLIAILDGAKSVGLEVDAEAEQVNAILEGLEKGQVQASPHGKLPPH